MVEYETAETKQAEIEVCKALSERLGVSMVHSGEFEIYDYSFKYLDDECILEVKSRSFASDKYRDTMIDKAKIDGCLALNKDVFLLAIKFTDGICTLKVDKNHKFRYGFAGRQDRNMKKDRKFCYFIPMKLFKRL